jgi:Queuosine biosynthesis protein QueC
MAKDLAIVLNNGSINSAVATAVCAQRYRPILVHAQLEGTPTTTRTRTAYDQQAGFFKPYREHAINLAALPAFGSSTAAAGAKEPRGPMSRAPQFLHLLSILGYAAQLAAQYQVAAIFLGMRVGNQGDELAQATEYLQIWAELLQMPCEMRELEITAPLLELEAWQVIDLGFQVTAPLERTWSCDDPGTEACWACRGCRARESAFQHAGKPDPLRTTRRSN